MNEIERDRKTMAFNERMNWIIAGVLGALGVMLLVSILPVHHFTQPVGKAGVILLVTAAG